MDKNRSAFFALVRAGLWGTEARLAHYGSIGWSRVYKLASEQSLLGLVLAGLERADVKPPQAILLQWIGEVQMLEQRNKAMNEFIAKLIDRLRNEDIYALLVKGQGIAQCYHKPLWRSCGDVDLLLSDSNYEKAKAFLLPLASLVEDEDASRKHLGVVMDGWVVELHGTLHTRQLPRLNKVVDEAQGDVFFDGSVRSWQNGDTQVFLPSANNDVVFVFAHILQHFFGGGIGLRQICDWCRLLYCYREELDVRLLETRLQKAGVMTEWRAFATLAIEWLGIPVEAMPLYDPSPKRRRKAARIVDYIIATGNFGHNREHVAETGLARKMNSLKRYTCDAMRHLAVFPLDAVKVWCRMVSSGIANIID